MDRRRSSRRSRRNSDSDDEPVRRYNNVNSRRMPHNQYQESSRVMRSGRNVHPVHHPYSRTNNRRFSSSNQNINERRQTPEQRFLPEVPEPINSYEEDEGTEDITMELVEDHPITDADLNKQLISLFECPVCFEYIVPPIIQCLQGHLICSKCMKRCLFCPICRDQFDGHRNLYMEKVSELLTFP